MRISDEDVARMAMLVAPVGERLRVDRGSSKPRLVDGLYVVVGSTGKWVLSIFRNVIEPANDVEIAIDASALVWPDSALYGKAIAWLEVQREELERAPSGRHGTQPADAFRIGLTLESAWTFLQRLSAQIVERSPALRWPAPAGSMGPSALQAHTRLPARPTREAIGATAPVGKVFIANFGRHNYLWPDCLRRSTIATFEDEDLRPFWLAQDRRGYINFCIKNKKTAANITPTAAVASRWFEVGNIVAGTSGDLWLHKDGDDLWWTTSRPGEAEVDNVITPRGVSSSARVFEIHKPANQWSKTSRTGTPLKWSGLHPRARDFLVTESTLVSLNEDSGNADYARALIDGADLQPWHSHPEWQTKLKISKNSAIKYYTPRESAIWRMVHTAFDTAAQADGRIVERAVKIKNCHFDTSLALHAYVTELLDAQSNLCALSGLPLQFDGSEDDREMLASLDRKDSSKHYEPGNLQVVCRFINRWKSDGDNDQFVRLIGVLRT